MYARSHRRAPSITGCVCRRTSQWRFIGSSPITLWIGTYAAPPLHPFAQPQGSPRPGQSQPPTPGQAESVICDQTMERCMGWLKGCRSIATRHEKLAVNFAALVKLAFLKQYLRILRPSDRT